MRADLHMILNRVGEVFPALFGPSFIDRTLDIILAYNPPEVGFREIEDAIFTFAEQVLAPLVSKEDEDRELDDPASNRRVPPPKKESKRKRNRYHDDGKPTWQTRSYGLGGCGALGVLADGIFHQAEIMNDRVGVELVALGKIAGDIFNPDHWMYDSMREYAGAFVSPDDDYWRYIGFRRD